MTEIFEGLHTDLKRPRLLCTLFNVETINDLNLPTATIPTDLSIKDKVLLFYEFEQAHSGNWIYKQPSTSPKAPHNSQHYESRILAEILLFYLCSYCLLITEEKKLEERTINVEKTIHKLRKTLQNLPWSPVPHPSDKNLAEELDTHLNFYNVSTDTLKLIKRIKEQITVRSSLLQPHSPCSADALALFTQLHNELELHYNNSREQIQAMSSLHAPSVSQIYEWLAQEAKMHSPITFSEVNSQLSESLQDTSHPLSFCYVFLLIELYLYRKLLNKNSNCLYTLSPLVHFYTIVYLSSKIEAWKQTAAISRITFENLKALLPFSPQTTNDFIRPALEAIDYAFRRKALFDSNGKLHHYFRDPLYVRRFGRNLRKYIKGELKVGNTYIHRSHKELANALGISRAALTDIINKKNKSIDPDTFLAALSLGIPDLFLMGIERKIGMQSNGLRRAVIHIPPPEK